MVDLSSKDFQDILDINNDLIRCRTFNELRTMAMASMRRVLDADTSVFFRVTGSEKSRGVDHGVAYGADDTVLANYHGHYKHLDPFLARALNEQYADRDPVIVSNRLVNYRSFERTEFYNDFFRPISVHSVLGITLYSNAKSIGLLAVHRPRNARHFNQSDQAKARLAVPGLSAALQRVMTLEQLDERDWILDTLAPELPGEGVLVLDAELDAVYCDARAREWLKVASGEDLNLVEIPEEVSRTCKRLLQNPDHSNHSPAPRIELDLPGARKLAARVRLASTGSGGIRFIIYLETEQKPLLRNHRLKLLGLTQREIDIVHQVGMGLTNSQIADNLCISVRTVQNHLRSIYTKIGVHNRTSLIYHVSAIN
jgi:DNA-binding CsgD family transcriptional regulator